MGSCCPAFNNVGSEFLRTGVGWESTMILLLKCIIIKSPELTECGNLRFHPWPVNQNVHARSREAEKPRSLGGTAAASDGASSGRPALGPSCSVRSTTFVLQISLLSLSLYVKGEDEAKIPVSLI